jgi:hypothetical protein
MHQHCCFHQVSSRECVQEPAVSSVACLTGRRRPALRRLGAAVILLPSTDRGPSTPMVYPAAPVQTQGCAVSEEGRARGHPALPCFVYCFSFFTGY